MSEALLEETRAGPGRPSTGARRRILDASFVVLKRDGYAGLTTAKVASEAGRNKALISYHFGGKLGLYSEVVERAMERLMGMLLIALSVQMLLEGISAYLADVDRAIISEVPFDIQKLALLLVQDKYTNPSNYAIMTISEGAILEGGSVIETGEEDAYGHKKLGGVGELVSEQIKQRPPRSGGLFCCGVSGQFVACGITIALPIVPLSGRDASTVTVTSTVIDAPRSVRFETMMTRTAGWSARILVRVSMPSSSGMCQSHRMTVYDWRVASSSPSAGLVVVVTANPSSVNIRWHDVSTAVSSSMISMVGFILQLLPMTAFFHDWIVETASIYRIFCTA